MNIENKSNNNDFNTSKQLGQNKQETSIIDETMQETIELSILYDFYGELLTDNNKEVFVEYIFNDLSLAEIADEKGITRQGIHDIIKRSSKKLREYEESLHLVKKFKSIEEKVNNIKGIIEELRLESQEVEDTSLQETSLKDSSLRDLSLEEMNNLADDILHDL